MIITTDVLPIHCCGTAKTPGSSPLLGDHIARFTRWIGIKRPCGGCKKRQRWLNTKHAAAIELVNGLHAAVRRRLKR